MFTTRPHLSHIAAIACVSVLAILAIGGSTAHAAPIRPQATTTWSYKVHVVNNTTDTLTLAGVQTATGSVVATPPPPTLAPGQSGDFEITSKYLSAYGTVSYSDPANGGMISIQGQANSVPNDSYSQAIGMNHLFGDGPQGYFSGVNPHVSASYSITT